MITDAAAQALAEGRLTAPPRACTVRPTRDYEIDIEKATGAAYRVWLLGTPSHVRLVLASEQPSMPAGNYSITDVTEAMREFIVQNFDWVAQCDAG